MTVRDYVAEVDTHELAVRILEALSGENRPPDMSAEAGLALMGGNDPEALGQILIIAETTAKYVLECMADAERTQ